MHTYRNSRNITGPLLLIASGLLLLSFSIWQMVMRPALTKSSYNREISSTLIDNNNFSVEVTVARAAYDQSQAQFLDLRDVSAYERSHIVGAVNIPLNDVTAHLSELNHNHWVILYTSRNNQPAGALTAQQLLSYGFVKANALAGGFEAWQEAGNPTEP